MLLRGDDFRQAVYCQPLSAHAASEARCCCEGSLLRQSAQVRIALVLAGESAYAPNMHHVAAQCMCHVEQKTKMSFVGCATHVAYCCVIGRVIGCAIGCETSAYAKTFRRGAQRTYGLTSLGVSCAACALREREGALARRGQLQELGHAVTNAVTHAAQPPTGPQKITTGGLRAESG